VDIVECISNPCKNNGTCNEGVNGYSCSCLPRFNGTHCEFDIIDDCVSQPCLNNGTCIDGVADFNCTCAEGFRGQRYFSELLININRMFARWRHL
jgi:hypothetical protein